MSAPLLRELREYPGDQRAVLLRDWDLVRVSPDDERAPNYLRRGTIVTLSSAGYDNSLGRDVQTITYRGYCCTGYR